MAVQFAPDATPNPLALALALKLRSPEGGAGSSDMEREMQQMFAKQYIANMGDYSPIQSPWQGAARLAQGLVGGIQMNRLLASERANSSALKKELFGDTAAAPAASTAVAAPAVTPQAGMIPPDAVEPEQATSPPPASPVSAAPQRVQMASLSPGVMPDSVPSQGPAGPDPQALAKALAPNLVALQQQQNVPMPRPRPAMASDGMVAPRPPANIPNMGGIDRSRFQAELDANPALVNRMASMVRGEVGLNRDPRLEKIQLESAFNRAQARGHSLEQSLLSVRDDPRRGYYASDTYRRPPTPQEIEYFQKNILQPVMAGSDEGTKFLGSPVTGNASQLGFAGRRLASGAYANGKWYGPPGGSEMFVTEKGDAGRLARSPLPSLAQMVQNNGGSVPLPRPRPQDIPQDPQQPPGMQNAPVRLAGLGGMPPGAFAENPVNRLSPAQLAAIPAENPVYRTTPEQRSVDPQSLAQPMQMAQAQSGLIQPGQPQPVNRMMPQMPPDVKAKAARLWELGPQGRAAANALMAPYLKPITPDWQKLNDDTLYEKNTATTRQVTPGYKPVVDPAERARFGIPPNDLRPYQVGPGNKLINPPAETRVNIDQSAPNEFEKHYGEGMGKRALATLEAADKASGELQNIQLLRRMNSDITTGKLTPATATVGGYLQSLGIDPAKVGIDGNMVAKVESMQALSNKQLMGLLGPGGFPSQNFSDTDRKFLEKIVTSPYDRPETNELKLAVAERIHGLSMDKAGAWGDAREAGQSYEKFERDWRRQIKDRNIFEDLQLPNIAQPLPPGAQPAGGSAPTPDAAAPGRVRVWNPATGQLE